MTGYTAQLDRFVHDRLPDSHELPEFLFDLPELQYPPIVNAAVEILDRQIELGQGSRIALRTHKETWDYQRLYDTTNQICHVLIDEMNIVPGNRVLLRSANNPFLVACWLAVLKVGAVAVTTMPLLRAPDLIPILNKGQIHHALCDRRLKDELEAANEQTGCLKQVLYFDGQNRTMADLQRKMADKPALFTAIETAAEDVAVLAFTSGTTGDPKGCIHFHRDILSMKNTFSDHILKPISNDIFIGSAPFAFTFGLGMQIVFPLSVGASTVLLEKGSPDDLAKAIEHFKATICATVPTAYKAILTNLEKHHLSSLKKCVSAGEHLPLATYNEWRKKTGLRLLNGIGATEMMHIFIAAKEEDIRPGAMGRPVPGFQACLLGEDRKPLKTGETGWLAIKGPTGCRYMDDARQSDYVFDGWNMTGDICRRDEDGYYWYISRGDSMIVSSGYNIGAQEVEDALSRHPAVDECGVKGVPDEERGQLVKAFVILSKGTLPSDRLKKELQDFVKNEIAPYKYPRKIVFVDALPRTQTGKLQRFKL